MILESADMFYTATHLLSAVLQCMVMLVSTHVHVLYVHLYHGVRIHVCMVKDSMCRLKN